MLGLALVSVNSSQLHAQSIFYLDTENGGGFGNNPNSFLWATFSPVWTTDSSGNSSQVAWSNATPASNAILGNGASVGASTAFLGGNISVGTLSVVNGTWTVNIGSNTLTFDSASHSNLDATITDSGSGPGSVVKTGSGTMTVTTTSNYTGGTTISGGALRFNVANTSIGPTAINSGGTLQLGASSTLPTSTTLTLAGGTLAMTGAFDQSFSTALAMSAGSTINFGSGFGASAVAFGNSSGQTWTGTLLVSNFSTAGGDTLRFGTSSSALSGAQLAAISFDGFGAQIDGSGFVTPVPEPETYALFVGATVLAVFSYRRRQLSAAAGG